MRIATGGIYLESNSFASLIATRQAFVRDTGLRFIPSAASRYCAENDVTLVPIGMALSSPSGLLPVATFDRLAAPLLEAARTLEFDAVLLMLHGAMLLEDERQGELELVKRLRQVIPATIPIALSLDLHANVSEELCDAVTFISALRTAPHRDAAETYIRAINLLRLHATSDLAPVTAYRKIPLVLPGEALTTATEPGASLYASLGSYEDENRCLIANLFTGFAWSDTLQTGMSVCVSAVSHEAAVSVADQIAEAVMACRTQMRLVTPLVSLNDAFAQITDEPVFISDTGDNITAGGRGDSLQVLLHAMRTNTGNGLFAPIWEPFLNLDDIPTSEIFALLPDSNVLFSMTGDQGTMAVVSTSVGDIILCSERTPFIYKAQFDMLNLNLNSYRYIVVKLGYLCPELENMGFRSILADTQGSAPINLARLPYQVVQPENLVLVD